MVHCEGPDREMTPDERRLKILFLPAWYPSEIIPVTGHFVKEHAKAASVHNDVIVLYAYPDPHPQRRHLCRVSDDTEDGVRTIRVRYGGILLHLWRRATGEDREAGRLPRSRAKAITLGRWLAVPRVIVGDLVCYWSIFSAFRQLLKGGGRPDIIHAHVFSAGVPAVLLGKLYRIPVVITEHWTGFPRRVLTFLDRKKARFAMNSAEIILPVSHDLGRHIRAYGIKNIFETVPNAVNIKDFHPPDNKEGAGKDKRLLLVGRLVPQKGVPYLLRALGQIRQSRSDFVLDVVGDGPNRAEYEELTKKLGLGGLVKFHGYRPKQRVAEFMRSCDFLAQPSLWETFGVVYVEAMACGKPVIGSDLPVLREIIRKEVGILVPPRDVRALARAIECMLDGHQNYPLGKIAEYARERFSYETVGGMLDRVYRRVLSRRK